jgi:hypothetical protein
VALSRRKMTKSRASLEMYGTSRHSPDRFPAGGSNIGQDWCLHLRNVLHLGRSRRASDRKATRRMNGMAMGFAVPLASSIEREDRIVLAYCHIERHYP